MGRHSGSGSAAQWREHLVDLPGGGRHPVLQMRLQQHHPRVVVESERADLAGRLVDHGYAAGFFADDDAVYEVHGQWGAAAVAFEQQPPLGFPGDVVRHRHCATARLSTGDVLVFVTPSTQMWGSWLCPDTVTESLLVMVRAALVDPTEASGPVVATARLSTPSVSWGADNHRPSPHFYQAPDAESLPLQLDDASALDEHAARVLMRSLLTSLNRSGRRQAPTRRSFTEDL